MSDLPTFPLRPGSASDRSEQGSEARPFRRARRGAPTLWWFATGVLALHTALLFFPPIPPDLKGSLWSHLLGYVFALLIARLAWSHPWTLRAAFAHAGLDRWTRVLGVVALALAGGLALRAAAPELFARMSREEGLFEPVTLSIYLMSAILLWRSAEREAKSIGENRRLLAGGFGLLVLEEIDYFGIFGGVFGRVQGIYAGSLHDIPGLWGVLTPMVQGAIILAGAGALFLILRYLPVHPRLFARSLGSLGGLWLLLGGASLGAALAGEAGMMGLTWTPPSPEELIELMGAVFLGAFATREATAAPLGMGACWRSDACPTRAGNEGQAA